MRRKSGKEVMQRAAITLEGGQLQVAGFTTRQKIAYSLFERRSGGVHVERVASSIKLFHSRLCASPINRAQREAYGFAGREAPVRPNRTSTQSVRLPFRAMRTGCKMASVRGQRHAHYCTCVDLHLSVICT